MNRKHTFLGAAILALSAAPVLAHDWDGNRDMEQSVLNDHTSGFVGASLSPGKFERGTGDTYGWAVLDVQAGEIRASSRLEKGKGDAYGSILNDMGPR